MPFDTAGPADRAECQSGGPEAANREHDLNILGLTCDQLAAELKVRYGRGRYHAAAFFRTMFKDGRTYFGGVAEFADAPEFGCRLAADLRLPVCEITGRREADGVLKFATSLADGRVIESVVIPANGRTTLCVSSQVGCRMGCRFCATGQSGFGRQLAVEEIVWQVYAARFHLGRRIDNVVFMGMGEPLDNPDNVVQAIRVISDQRGFDIACRRMTLSTAGHVDGIRKLADCGLDRLKLAVSLNAADDALRDELMPINRRYPLKRLKEALDAFPLGKKGVVFVEYVLLAGINDSPADADRLDRYLGGLPVRINIIAFNCSVDTPFRAPAPETVRRFCERLTAAGRFVRLRQSRGAQILAGCGQLGAVGAEKE